MLDINILISLILFKSFTLKEMLSEILNSHTLVLCTYVIDELYDVVNRKFPGKADDLTLFLNSLDFQIYKTPKVFSNKDLVNMRDLNDIPVLYSAIKSKSDILITGDKDFSNLNVKNLKIMTPSEFLELF